MKTTSPSLHRSLISSFALMTCTLFLSTTSVHAQQTSKEQFDSNRQSSALWSQSKNKEEYMHYQPDTTKAVMLEKKNMRPVRRKRPKDYNIRKGNINLLLCNNTYDYNWTYIPEAGSYEKFGTAFLGVGIGLEYAYKDNRIVSFGYTVGVNRADSLAITEKICIVQQLDLLHTWNIGRFALSAGPTIAKKKWSYSIDIEGLYEYSPEKDAYIRKPESAIPAPWQKEFSFKHWSAGLKAKAHFRLAPAFSIGVEYAARSAWKETFSHKYDHQVTVKMQIRACLARKR